MTDSELSTNLSEPHCPQAHVWPTSGMAGGRPCVYMGHMACRGGSAGGQCGSTHGGTLLQLCTWETEAITAIV